MFYFLRHSVLFIGLTKKEKQAQHLEESVKAIYR